MKTPQDYIEPASLEEAREKYIELLNAIRDIESQLTFRKVGFLRREISPSAYHTWRAGAVHAMNQKRSAVTLLKNWISRKSIETTQMKRDSTSAPLAKAREAFSVLRRAFTDLFTHVEELEKKLHELDTMVSSCNQTQQTKSVRQ